MKNGRSYFDLRTFNFSTFPLNKGNGYIKSVCLCVCLCVRVCVCVPVYEYIT